MLHKTKHNEMLVHSGCDQTVLTKDFKRFVVRQEKGEGMDVQLGGVGCSLKTSAPCTLHIPVAAVGGGTKIMVEKAVFSKSSFFPLFAVMHRKTDLFSEEQKVLVDGINSKFLARVTRNEENVPLLSIKEDKMALAATSGARTWSSDDVRHRKEQMGKDELKALLYTLHKRVGHAKGRRLYLTLIEKGWDGVFTERECKDVECGTCRLLNEKKAAIPRVQDVERKDLAVGQVAVQDLTTLKVAGIGGYKYISVIVDAASRQVSARALVHKDEAVEHTVAYVRRMEKQGNPVKQ